MISLGFLRLLVGKHFYGHRERYEAKRQSYYLENLDEKWLGGVGDWLIFALTRMQAERC